MLSQIFKNVYMRLDEKAVTMAQPQKMWSGILVSRLQPLLCEVNNEPLTDPSIELLQPHL